MRKKQTPLLKFQGILLDLTQTCIGGFSYDETYRDNLEEKKNQALHLFLKGITGSCYEKLYLASAILFSLRREESDGSF